MDDLSVDEVKVEPLEEGERNEPHSRRQNHKKNAWTQEEDNLLIQLVEATRNRKWNQIAYYLPNRTGKQCRQRYVNHLAEGVSKQPWSADEEWVLFLCTEVFGTKWAQICQYLPGRTDNRVKNHWNCKFKKNLPMLKIRLMVELEKFQGQSHAEKKQLVVELLERVSGVRCKDLASNERPAEYTKINVIEPKKKKVGTRQSAELFRKQIDKYILEFGMPSDTDAEQEPLLESTPEPSQIFATHRGQRVTTDSPYLG